VLINLEMTQGAVVVLFDFRLDCLVGALFARPLLCTVHDGLATRNAGQIFSVAFDAGSTVIWDG